MQQLDFSKKPILISFLRYFLSPIIVIFSGCWFAEETPVKVLKAVLHPNADSLDRLKSNESPSNSRVLFQASGWVEPDPFEIRVTSLTDGVVDEVFILEGEVVTEGQIVAKLVDDDAKLSLALAEANLLHSKEQEDEFDAELEMLHQNLLSKDSFYNRQLTIKNEQLDLVKRLKKLPAGAISQLDINQSIFKLESLDHLAKEAAFKKEEISQKKALLFAKKDSQKAKSFALKISLEKAFLELNRTTIRSPKNGVVTKLLTSPGKRIMSSMDSPDASSVAILFEQGKLQARIDVPLADAASVFVGQEVEIISSLLPERIFRGLVTRISGEADFQRNTLEIKVRLLDPDHRLRPEMLCRAKFLAPQIAYDQNVSASELGVLIPQILIPETGKKNHQLFIVSQDGKTVEIVPIEVGDQIVGDHISIISGLRGGERIISDPPKSLRSGDRIKITNP
jgi:RND family efflux transporter MFP subunit